VQALTSVRVLLVVCRLKAAKRRARELAQALNSCKLRLDESRGQQEQAKQARLAAGGEAQEVRRSSSQVAEECCNAACDMPVLCTPCDIG
jgi:hypothetical protein